MGAVKELREQLFRVETDALRAEWYRAPTAIICLVVSDTSLTAAINRSLVSGVPCLLTHSVARPPEMADDKFGCTRRVNSL